MKISLSDVERKIIAKLKNNPSVIGLAIAGSRHEGISNKNSDLDIVCFTDRKKLALSALHLKKEGASFDIYLLPKIGDIKGIPHDRVYSIKNSTIVYEKGRYIQKIKEKIDRYFDQGPRYGGDVEWMVYHLEHLYEKTANSENTELFFWAYKTAYYATQYFGFFENKWVHGEKAFFRQKSHHKFINSLSNLYKTKEKKKILKTLSGIIELSVGPNKKLLNQKNILLKEFTSSQWPEVKWDIGEFEKKFIKDIKQR